jgi:iron complex transport system substrate-binding protein
VSGVVKHSVGRAASSGAGRAPRRLIPGVVAFLLIQLFTGCDARKAETNASLTRVASRIISIAPNATEMVAELGQTHRLVGVCTFCVHPPEVNKLPRIGGLFDANPEAILKLAPDLVILRGANPSIEHMCRVGSIALMRDRTERLADIPRTVRDLGERLNCRAEAERVCTTMEQRLARIRQAVAGRPRPRVLMTLARRPDALGDVMTGGRETFIHDMIEAAGGDNVFADKSLDYPRVSVEAILVARPEVILEALPETPPSEELVRRMREQWRAVGPIPAVTQGRIDVLFDDHCLIPSPRIVEVISKMARILHPEATLD